MDVPETVAKIPGVELAVYRGDDDREPVAPLSAEGNSTTGTETERRRRGGGRTVHVSSADGRATVWSVDGEGEVVYAVDTDAGADPLALFARGTGWHRVRASAREWLARADRDAYPYGPVRLWRLLWNRVNATAGDIVVTSARGYDFGLDYELFMGNYKGCHGGLRRDVMNIPVVLAGRGVARQAAPHAPVAMEDVGATIKHLLEPERARTADRAVLRGRVIRDILAAQEP